MAAESKRTLLTPISRAVMAIVALGFGLLLASLVAGVVLAIGGWDFAVAAGIGDDLGRVAGQRGAGQPLDHNRVPLVIAVLLNVPLWAGFIGVPLAARNRGLDWRRDLGWGMRAIDVPVGLGIGVATQALLVPLLYVPILRFADSADLEEPARNLVATATSPVGVAALIVLTVIGAPIAEEIVFRGLLFRGLADEGRSRRFGLTLAVAASSAVFAISHFQLLQFPGLFLIGAIAAFGLQRTGRLGTAIWIHAGFNATTVVILLAEIY